MGPNPERTPGVRPCVLPFDRPVLFLFSLVASWSVSSANLIISGVADMGQGRCFVELVATDDVLNIQGYTLLTVYSFTFPADTVLKDEYDYVIVASQGLDMEAFIGAPVHHLYSIAVQPGFSGNAGIYLLAPTTMEVIDQYGWTYGPGVDWSYTLGWVHRDNDVMSPNYGDFSLTEWTINKNSPNLKDCSKNWQCGDNAYPFNSRAATPQDATTQVDDVTTSQTRAETSRLDTTEGLSQAQTSTMEKQATETSTNETPTTQTATEESGGEMLTDASTSAKTETTTADMWGTETLITIPEASSTRALTEETLSTETLTTETLATETLTTETPATETLAAGRLATEASSTETLKTDTSATEMQASKTLPGETAKSRTLTSLLDLTTPTVNGKHPTQNTPTSRLEELYTTGSQTVEQVSMTFESSQTTLDASQTTPGPSQTTSATLSSDPHSVGTTAVTTGKIPPTAERPTPVPLRMRIETPPSKPIQTVSEAPMAAGIGITMAALTLASISCIVLLDIKKLFSHMRIGLKNINWCFPECIRSRLDFR